MTAESERRLRSSSRFYRVPTGFVHPLVCDDATELLSGRQPSSNHWVILNTR